MPCRLRRPFGTSIVATLALGVSFLSAPASHAREARELAMVRPVQSCGSLAHTALDGVTGARTSLATRVVSTAKGAFCEVDGSIAPAIGFRLDLPQTKWTGRYLQAGCGGLCGMINASIGNAGGCRPALDGAFAVAATDMGHTGHMGGPDESAFAADPQKRIDFAYRANHVTALAAKALIRAYYGTPARHAYFSGCSDGGREALMEAQRYPDDFDGISAGAPAMAFQVQNSFFHAWTVAANRDAAGRPILLAGRLAVLHAAVIAHCDRLDGIADGLLSDPRACRVRRDWVACPAHGTDSAHCLTDAEWRVAEKEYQGPADARGHRFLPGGLMPGSEPMWTSFIPRSADDKPMSAALFASMVPVVHLAPTGAESDIGRFAFTTAEFDSLRALHPLNDATDPDLRAFAARGGKLILWHGWADFSIAPMISVAYYRAVQAELGMARADEVLRLFMIPGVGHCGGGDGFAQIDTLSPLIAWVETGRKPDALTAQKVAAVPDPGTGPDMPPQGGSDGRGGGMGPMAALPPVAIADRPSVASRPVYPFPQIARLRPGGDPKSASGYVAGPGPVAEPARIDWYGASLLSPGFQTSYEVREGRLTPVAR